ncbi:MAG: peroxidase family protein, partial [Elusimicrobiota bacterium]|nr:peroxidase family protein [Elusimicrobiota bacterium]
RAAVAPAALAAGEALQAELAAEGGRAAAPAAQGATLERFWAGRALTAPADAPTPTPAPAPGDERASGLSPAAGDAKAAADKVPVSPENHPELFEPRSSRVGIGPARFVYWNAIYSLLQWANLKFAKDPNRRVSWDKWPTKLGLLYLIGKIRFVRSGTLTDPYDYASNEVKAAGAEPETAKKGYTADGSWVSDRERPRMGAENTRFGSNIPPKKVRPDVENMTPSAREVGKLKWRRLDADGKPIVQPAGILNNLAGGWIQFQFHNFGGNTKRDPITENPHKLPRTAADGWPEKEATVDRTTKDPTRVTDNGRPTVMNERTQAWIQAQIYGTNEAEQSRLRSYRDGLMLLDENGNLPADPSKPGIDLSGFTNNYNPLLSFLHWAFVVNHNEIAAHLRKFNPDWSDEDLFQYARKINVANINLIHTVEWTEDLLQHPTLQEGMHAEFYGLFGPKVKAWVMRLTYRHPWLRKLLRPITDNDVIWGMPGSKWEHHDGPFQVPKHFRMVYRLHEMILDEQELIQPGTDRTLDRVELLKFVHGNTRPIVEKFGYDVLAYSFARKSAGALTLHNFPRALSQFENQQNGQLTDLAELDIFRERTDGTGTYNEFRRSVGEPPVTSFLELTGGDAELAKELSVKYEGDVNKVDAGIGILAEPKPAGFALGFTQFYQFVLNAPRRVKSNRHLTEYFTHKDYTFEGMEWVLQSGGMGGVIARAMKGLPHGKAVVDAMEGVTRWFTPWPDTETFPVRLLDQAQAESGAILKATLKLLGIGTFTAFAAWMGVAVSGFTVVPVAAAALALPVLLYYKRMLAWRFMQKAWQSAYTDRRRSMFPTLFLGEKWARTSVALGRLGARAALAVSGYAAFTLFSTNPVVATFAVLTALSSLGVLKATKKYENTMQILKIALQNRLREGYPTATVESVKGQGETAMERRYWFLVPAGAKQPVARLLHTYRVLHEHGLGRLAAFKTALISHLVFGPRTQRGLGIKGRWRAGILFNPFAIYVPNMVQAQGPSTTRIYAAEGNSKGLKAGDVDLEEFDRMFSTYAPGRDYMTAYDFSRMREGNRWRAAREGVGGPVSRFIGSIAVKKRTEQLLQLYADRVANEDKVLVPAISRDMLLRVYQGTAQADIMAERALDGVHPDLRSAKPVDPDAKPTLKQRAGSDIRKLVGSVRTLAGSLVLPYTPGRVMTDLRAFGRFFSEVWRLGWVALAAVFTYYLIRDSILYLLIPYLLFKGIIG